VTHGTREEEWSKKLLRNDVTGQGLRTLIPDAVIYQHRDVAGIVDAK